MRGHAHGWAGAGSLACLAAVACGSVSGNPIGSGDLTIVDVDATPAPPVTTPDPVDSAIYVSPYEAGILFTVCSSVPASPDAAADGASARPDAGKAKASADGGTSDEGGAYSDGGASCQPLPAVCYANVTCACVITALATQLPCAYPHCTDDKGFNLYCP